MEDDDASDEGLNNPAYHICATWQEHRLHGNYPEAGGYSDQDPSLVIEDWGYVNTRFNWWFATLNDMGDNDNGALFDEPGGDVKGWQEL